MALIDLVRELCSLNDDNLAERVIKDSDVQWCLSELLDILEQEEKQNEPLTLEELRMIVEPTPIWWDWVRGWVLVRQGMVVTWSGRYHTAGSLRGDFYRRPPEGKEERP